MEKNRIPGSWIFFSVWTIVIVAVLAAGGWKYRSLEKELEEARYGSDSIKVADNIELTKATVMAAISDAEDLITTKYYYTDVDQYEKSAFGSIKVPFTTDHTVFSFSGTIGVGVDLNRLREEDIEIDNEKKEITISMPSPDIMYHSMDTGKFESWNLKDSVFTSVDMAEYAQMEDALKKREEQKMRENDEFWVEAEANTEKAVKGMVELLDKDGQFTINVHLGIDSRE